MWARSKCTWNTGRCRFDEEGVGNRSGRGKRVGYGGGKWNERRGGEGQKSGWCAGWGGICIGKGSRILGEVSKDDSPRVGARDPVFGL